MLVVTVGRARSVPTILTIPAAFTYVMWTTLFKGVPTPLFTAVSTTPKAVSGGSIGSREAVTFSCLVPALLLLFARDT